MTLYFTVNSPLLFLSLTHTHTHTHTHRGMQKLAKILGTTSKFKEPEG